MCRSILLAIAVLAPTALSLWSGEAGQASPEVGVQGYSSYSADRRFLSPPPALAAQLRSVDLLIAQGSLLPARSAVEELLGRHGEDAAVALSAARLYTKMGLSAFAIVQYEKVRRLKPLMLEPLVALSRLHLENLSTELAVRLAREAVTMEPASREARMALISALLAGQSVRQARIQAEALGHMYPDDAEVDHALSEVARAYGENARSLELMLNAVNSRPAEASWQMELADLYIANQKYEKAREVLNGVLARDPQSLRALERLAHLNEFYLHDYMAARRCYAQIKSALPDSSSAQAGMDRCLVKQGDLALNFRNFVRKLFNAPLRPLKDEEGASDALAPDTSFGAR